jgi:hypothetical protein
MNLTIHSVYIIRTAAYACVCNVFSIAQDTVVRSYR